MHKANIRSLFIIIIKYIILLEMNTKQQNSPRLCNYFRMCTHFLIV